MSGAVRHHNRTRLAEPRPPLGDLALKIAITGASGLLGRSIVSELTALGHDCRGLSRPDSPRAAHRPAIEWVVGTLTDPAAVGELVQGADAVVHAAHDGLGGDFQDPAVDSARLVERNLITTIRLIEAARAAGASRFVAITSGAVHGVVLADRPLDETHPLWPRSHYGATKAAIEAFVSSYGRGQGFAICALRPTAIYGPAEPLAASRWFDLIAAIVRGEPVDCRQGAKVVHARDVARAVAIVLDAGDVAGEVFHCVDQFVTEHEVAVLARSLSGSASPITGASPSAGHPISAAKLRRLGMTFGGAALLATTVGAIVAAIQANPPTD